MPRRKKKDDDELAVKDELLPAARRHRPSFDLLEGPYLQPPHPLNRQPEAQTDSFSQWFQDEVERASGETNLSVADAQAIVSQSLAAFATLDRLCNEVLPGLPEIRAAIRQEDDVARFNETVLRAVQLACYLLAVVRETNKIIFERLSKNGTNRNFGFFLLAANYGNNEMYLDAQKQLLRIALSIPFKEHWKHPGEPEVWKERATSVLHKEFAKHQHLDVSGILERMIGNQFAYMYTAFRREFIDELRSLKRNGYEEQFPEVETADFGKDSQEIEFVEDEQDRQSVIKFVTDLEQSSKLPPGPRAFVSQLVIYLTEPSKWVELEFGDAAREVAQRTGVSVQQARSYRRKLSALAEEDSEIGREIRQLQEHVIKLRFREKDGGEL